MKSKMGSIRVRFCAAFLFLALGAYGFGAEREAGKRYAVLVGINDYADGAILKLSTARNDAVDLGRALSDAGWDKVFVLRDDVDFRNQDFPNRTNIENRVLLLAELVSSEDTVFFFFSGHGMASGDAPHILPVDASLNRLAETSIPLSSVISAFTSRGIRRIVVAVDACREQVSITKGLSVVGVTDAGGGGTASLTLFATKAGWYSYEDERGRNGVFTRFMLEGLSGKADGEGSAGERDGEVTFSEVAAWIPDAVAAYALDKGIRQKPVAIRGSGDATALTVPLTEARLGRSAKASIQIDEDALPSDDDVEIEAVALREERERPRTGDGTEKSGFFFFQLGFSEGLQLFPSRYSIGGPAVGALSTRNAAVYGVQVAAFPRTETIAGLQVGAIAQTDTTYGGQISAINTTGRTVRGCQIGVINTAAAVYGAQIGVINTTRRMRGIQIGVLNTISESGFFGRFMIGCNIGF